MRRTPLVGMLWLLLTLAAAAVAVPRRVIARAKPIAAAAGLAAPPGWKAIQQQILGQFPWGLNGRTAEAMREFGLMQRQLTEYAPLRASAAARGERLSTTVWVFGDGRGAYGAKTYLRSFPGPGPRAVPARRAVRRRWLLTASGAVSTRAWRVWVDAVAGKVPSPLPLLRQQLPRRGLVAHSAGYAEGPASLAVAAPWLPPQAVNFAMEPIIATGRYQWGSRGRRARRDAKGATAAGELAILSYPTPQIAAAQLKPIRAAADLARRSGPLVVAWHGAAAPQARQLVSAVQYEAVVTWNRPLHEKTLAGLILAIFVLIGFILAACVAAGIFTGGMRMLLAKWFPGRFALRPERIIRLKL